MVDVVQLVRASDCGSECRGFESHPPPKKKTSGNPINKRVSAFLYTYKNAHVSLKVRYKVHK